MKIKVLINLVKIITSIFLTCSCRFLFKYQYFLFSNCHFNCSMVFCYQNCSDLLWEKIVLVIEKNFWNSRLKAENFQSFWDQKNNLFEQWKVKTIFGNRMFLHLFLKEIRTIHSNSERSEQFLVTECFFNLFLTVPHI